MLFNSYIFLLFFFVVYVLYLANSKSLSRQNILLLVASYVFYGTWDWRFLFLIILSTLVDYVIGLKLYETQIDTVSSKRKRKYLVILSVLVNLGILGFFKYFNFFADNLEQILRVFGLHPDPITLNIILPVGISFYTFQTMSYTLDIYRGTLKPTKNLLNFALFVAFFPQLVAGPIERAANLLPQVEGIRPIYPKMINSAIFLILWGYVKKVVIADHAGIIADQIFNNYQSYCGLDILIAVLAFSVQIYCDFSAYSDIARGISRLMGFELMVNFRLPYFASSPSDFWQRWHISLSSWLRDYLYIPLGGNRKGAIRTNINLMLTMLLGGLWHGASWNFVLWGVFHGILLIGYRMNQPLLTWMSKKIGRHKLVSTINIVVMFCFTLIGWLLFRAHSTEQIVYMFSHISFLQSTETATFLSELIFYSTPLIAMQCWQGYTGNLLIPIKMKWPVQALVYTAMLLFILIFGVKEPLEFIYFQF